MGGGASSASKEEAKKSKKDEAHFQAAFTKDVMLLSKLSARQIRQRLSRSPTRETTLGERPCQYAGLMFRGLYPDQTNKPCQDSYVVNEATLPGKEVRWFQVFDGHGPDGHECAWYCRDNMERVANDIYSRKLSISMEDLLLETHETVNSNMHNNHLVPSKDSGSTAVSILAVGSTLYCSNVGDSRCILGVRDAKGKIVPKCLSQDQTLYRSDERARVRKAGGRVLSIGQIEGRVPMTDEFECKLGDEIDEDGDPPRIWLAQKFEPGCAFSRSIGDKVAESVGCIATPEIIKHELTDDDVMAVIATDGVWEFLTNQQVLDICAREADPYRACYKIIARSYREWYTQEERSDDITLIVLYFGGGAKNETGTPPEIRDEKLPDPDKRVSNKTRRGSNIKVDPNVVLASKKDKDKQRGRRGSFNFPSFAAAKKPDANATDDSENNAQGEFITTPSS